jgi:hypothetical protein
LSFAATTGQGWAIEPVTIGVLGTLKQKTLLPRLVPLQN